MLSQSLAAKSRAIKRSIQRGVTLIELSVVIVILSLLAFALYQFADPGGRGKAVGLLSYMTEVANSAQRIKTDTGCYPRAINVLYNRVVAGAPIAAAATFCGVPITADAWNGPYIKPGSVPAAAPNCVAIDKFAGAATVCLATAAGGPVGSTNYIVKANNIPSELALQLLKECNGVEPAPNAAFAAGKCRIGTATLGGTSLDVAGGALPSAGAVSTVDMLFDSTR